MPDTTRRGEHAVAAGGKTDWAKLEAMTDEEAEAAARADTEFPPLAEGRSMHPMARTKRMRRALLLSQEEFASRYHIPLETLLAWERYKAEPDAVANAFLDAIAADPDGVAKALAVSPVMA